MSNHIYTKSKNVPIYHWTKGLGIDDNSMQQLQNIASMPFIHHHVAAMPDVHYGKGATIGSVIATKGAIVPAAVGVDLGCGMMATKTNLKACDLPDNLHILRMLIESHIPVGRTDNGGNNDKGSFSKVPFMHERMWHHYLKKGFQFIKEKHPKAIGHRDADHLGTLGTGNHFIEICLDENDFVWVMLHSGSRGPGNKIGSYFIEQAKLEMERYFIGDYLPDKNLAYLVEYTEIFNDYVFAVEWSQKYAKINRSLMMEVVLNDLTIFLDRPVIKSIEAVNCHHNYISRENHFNENVWVTRKGAVRAREKDLGIIPGSMGTGSFIVRGLGNKHSFCSCSHGAGRVMSRAEARRIIKQEDHIKAMKGIEARLDEGVIDESPAAYKDIGKVMEAQSDLVQIVARLKQIVNIKG